MNREQEALEAELENYARVVAERDNLIIRAQRAGITKNRIHTITGISRSTIDRLLSKENTMTTTTGYGTWNNHGDSSALTVEATVAGYISGADSEWIDRIQADGSFDDMVAAYRAAINAALPDGVSLNGNDFYGPAYDADKDFDGYPTDEDGALDITAIITEINLAAIVDEHDPDNE